MVSTNGIAGVHASDVRQLLRREGLMVAPHRLRYAVQQRYIPAPFTTASGDHAWRPADLPAVVRYFRSPRRPGRPRKNPTTR
jgi:hypothetical protein